MSIKNARHHRHDRQDTAYLHFPHARYQLPDGSTGTITLQSYLQNPRPELTLKCPNCEAQLIFKSGTEFAGGTAKTVKPHFATKAGSKHAPSCRFQPDNSHETMQQVDRTQGLRLNFNLSNTSSLPADGNVIPIQRGKRGHTHLPDDMARREAKSITAAADVACVLRTVPNDRRVDSLVIHDFRATEWQQFFVDMRPASDRLEHTRTARDLADAILGSHATHPVAVLFNVDADQVSRAGQPDPYACIYEYPAIRGLKDNTEASVVVTPCFAFAQAMINAPGTYLAIGFPNLARDRVDDQHFYLTMNVRNPAHICPINPAKIKRGPA